MKLALCCISIIVIIIIIVIFKESTQKQEFKKKIVFGNLTPDQKKIPKNIFITSDFNEKDLPVIIRTQFDELTEKNPDYVLYYYDSDMRRDFIKNFYPSYLKDYDSIIPGAYKADVWRYLVLYKYGGVYMDVGHRLLYPLKNIIDLSDEFISSVEFYDLGIHNSFICAYPDHPILQSTIEIMIKNIRNKSYGINSVDITGPTTFQRGYNRYFENEDLDPIPVGNFNFNGHKVKFYFHDYNDSDKYESYIVDNLGKDKIRLIKTKFEGYEDIMYPRGGKKIKYQQLYDDRKVFLP